VLAVILINNSGQNETDSLYYSVPQNKWPKNDLTEGLPEFKGDIYSVLVTDMSTAVFIREATESEIEEYADMLSAYGFSFGSDDFPKTAQTDDMFITLSYEESTMLFSITFLLKEEPPE
jgi:hypothetical protein